MAGQHGNIWRKKVLLPLWIIQLIAAIIFLGLSAFALWVWNHYQGEVADIVDDQELVDEADDLIDINAAINLSFSLYTILSVFVEMVLFCTHRLGPVLSICLQCLKSAIWTVYLVMTIIAVAYGGGVGTLILVLVLFLTSILLLGQAAQVVHKKRKGTLYRGEYAAANPVRYEPGPYEQSTGYTGESGPSPFRDPSPAPPYNPQAIHPTARPAGQSGEYYGGSGSYEMQQSTVR